MALSPGRHSVGACTWMRVYVHCLCRLRLFDVHEITGETGRILLCQLNLYHGVAVVTASRLRMLCQETEIGMRDRHEG